MNERREVLPIGPTDANIVLIGEAPGKWEAIYGEPFTGRAGEVLENCLHSAGLIRAEVYITNVLKVRPGQDSNDIAPYFTGKGFTAIGQTWVDRLKEELEALPANVLVPMGNTALFALTGMTGISNVRGSVYPCSLVPGRKVIPTIHPAATLYDKQGEKPRNFFERYLITEDFKKVKRHQHTRDLMIPHRELLIRPTFEQALEYIAALKQARLAPFDIETINNQVSCISFAKNAHDAISITPGDYTADREMALWRAIDDLLGDPTVIKQGQNLIFDSQFLFESLGILVRGPIQDTMYAHHVLYPELPKKLPVISSIYTDEPYYKDEGKIWSGKDVVRKVGEDNFRRYSAKDSVILPEIWPQLEEQLNEDLAGYMDYYDHVIRTLPSLIYMSVRGVRTDQEIRDKLKQDLSTHAEELQVKLDKLAGQPLNANSFDQLYAYFYVKKGVPPFRNRKNGRPTTDDKAMQRLAQGAKGRPPFPEARLVQEIRRVKRLKNTYVDITLDDDQRLRGAMNPVGTMNTRLSSSRLLRGYKKKVGLQMQNIPRFIRRFAIPDEGRIFIVPDKAQGEWVIVAYVCGDGRMMYIVENGLDAHVETAKFITGLPEDYIKAEVKLIEDSRDPDFIAEMRAQLGRQNPAWAPDRLLADNPGAWLPRTYSCRAIGKHSNHGLNYRMGANRFAEEYEVSEDEGERVVKGYPIAYSGIQSGFWDWVGNRLEENRTLYDLYGRKRVFLGPAGDQLLKDALDYIPQSTLARLTQRGQIKIYEDRSPFMRQLELLNNMHDGLLTQMPYDRLPNVANAIMRMGEHLDEALSFKERTFHIRTDFKIGFSWHDLIGVKADSVDQLVADLPGYIEKAKEAYERTRREALRTVDSTELASEG